MNLFKSKKGDTETRVPLATGETLLGALIVIILLSLAAIILFALFSNEIDCNNKGEWNKLAQELINLDNNPDYNSEILFFNGEQNDCKLVGFSAVKQTPTNIEKYYRGDKVPLGSALCLCKMTNFICDSYKCYSFKNINEILNNYNFQQVSTVGADSYLTLKLQRTGDKALIDIPLPTSQEKSITYTHILDYSYLDKGLINEMVLTFPINSQEQVMTSFIPIVSIDTSGLVPSQFSYLSPPFPLIFNIELANIEDPTQYPTLEDVKNKAPIVRPEFISKSKIAFVIPEEYAKALIQNRISVFYKKNKDWQGVQVDCTKDANNLICITQLNLFTENFIITP